MGSLSGGSNCFRDVVFHPSERSHQSFGNVSVLLALYHFKLCLESLSIVLATDNTTVVAYLKNQEEHIVELCISWPRMF
jgi:hypothetical protein